MNKDSLIKVLTDREKALSEEHKKLLKELNAIRDLLEVYITPAIPNLKEDSVPAVTPKQVNLTPTSKGDKSWEDYALIILKELGGVARADEVANYAVKNCGGNYSEVTIIKAIKSKLYVLGINGTLFVDKTGSKREGYVFKVNENKD